MPPAVTVTTADTVSPIRSAGWVVPVHVAAVALIQATAMALMAILPVLARKQFAASELETLVITAAPTVMFVLSIFWNDVFERSSTGKYLAIFWLVSCLPLAFVAFARDAWMIIVPHVLASLGGSGYHPVAGELLKRLYADRSRGRVYGLVWGSSMVAAAGLSYGVGELLNRDPASFRWFMPAAAGLQLLGCGLLAWLAHATGVSAARAIRVTDHGRSRVQRLLEPITHMGSILKSDPVFARYEGAYMTYGVGWMIAYALLPLLATDKLGLRYDQFTESTSVPYQTAIVAMLLPAGWLMDRLGAVRSTGLSFAMLTLYPLGLIWAGDVRTLTVVSVWYGIAHAGASVGWMLGPVALAPSPASVPRYVAIHATLVGLRGAVFQGLGVALYKVTGSFTWPLIFAAAAYVWSAVQMWRLHGRVRDRAAVKPG